MKRLASREPDAAAVATCPMPSSSAQVTAALHQRLADAVPAVAGTTAGLCTWRTGSGFTGEYAAALRKTAPANSPSYSATTRRSPGPVAEPARSRWPRRSAARPPHHDAGTAARARPAVRHRQEWLRAGHQGPTHPRTSRSTKERHRPVPPLASHRQTTLSPPELSQESRDRRYRHRRQRRHGAPRVRRGRPRRQPPAVAHARPGHRRPGAGDPADRRAVGDRRDRSRARRRGGTPCPAADRPGLARGRRHRRVLAAARAARGVAGRLAPATALRGVRLGGARPVHRGLRDVVPGLLHRTR